MTKQLLPTLRLSLDMTDVLARIEQTGIRVNLDTLQDIRDEYEQELDRIEKRLNDIVADVMGDTPINLNSSDDRSLLFYSRKITNKDTWARLFNIGHEMRGATKKIKMRKLMQFVVTVLWSSVHTLISVRIVKVLVVMHLHVRTAQWVRLYGYANLVRVVGLYIRIVILLQD